MEETGLIEVYNYDSNCKGYKNSIYEADPKKKASNLINRLVWILTGVWCCNKRYDKETAENILNKIQIHFEYKNNSMLNLSNSNEKFYCLCGHTIIKACVLKQRNNEEVYIGVECIRNFFKNAKTEMNKNDRKTFDCKVCKKRNTKDSNNLDLCICNQCNLIRFGKYRGKKFSEIKDNRYFEWIISSEEFKCNEKTRKTIEIVLGNTTEENIEENTEEKN